MKLVALTVACSFTAMLMGMVAVATFLDDRILYGWVWLGAGAAWLFAVYNLGRATYAQGRIDGMKWVHDLWSERDGSVR